MEFRVLGPLEIRDDQGRELPLGQGRERALLALLLLHANETVLLDRIVEDLWEDGAPPTASKMVRNLVSHLRRLIDGRLVTAGRGYRLDVPPASLDLERFEALAAQGRRELAAGRPDAAAATLTDALSLWRGAPLGEFAYERFATAEIVRLEELRATAVEDRLDAQLALGLHAEAVPELEQLVERYPLRERLRRQLMLALYRSGRQAEALEQYRRARAMLVEELGLEPAAELRELERAILAHDPALAPAAPSEETAAHPGVTGDRRLRALLRPRVLAAVGLLLLCGAGIAAGVSLLGGHGSAPVLSDSNAVVVDPSSGRVVGQVDVGNRPIAVAVGAGSVWVANADDGTVSKIDPGTRAVAATIGLGVPESDVAVGSGSVWVTSGSEGTLLRIDPTTDTVVQTIDLAGSNPIAPEGAYGVAIGAGAVWVGSASRRVFRVDPASGTVETSIPVGHIPSALAVSGGDVWVGVLGGRTVRIDPHTNAITATVAGPSSPMSIAAGAGAIWVADELDTVWQIDPVTASVTRAIPVAGRPFGIAVSGSQVWVAATESASLTRIDGRSGKIVGSVPIGGSPLDVATGAGALWVAAAPASTGSP